MARSEDPPREGNPAGGALAEPIDACFYAAEVPLADGGMIHIRAVRPDDKPLLQELFNNLSDRSVYYRFFSHKRQLSAEELDFLTHMDYVRHVALAAVIPRTPGPGPPGPGHTTEQVIGVGRYAVQGQGRAEVAYAVADAHHRRGIGSVLLRHLAVIARAAGLDTFVANVLPENVPLQRAFLAHNGFSPMVTVAHGVAQLSFLLGPAEHREAPSRTDIPPGART